ncbi:MAG: diguanylate cyclase [Planctomycetota bacterium]|nr:diguanylate cyclase [Planctomycetota bacterium]MDA1211140.1 diguanylate cyclase [Planctomycetota bacterium]
MVDSIALPERPTPAEVSSGQRVPQMESSRVLLELLMLGHHVQNVGPASKSQTDLDGIIAPDVFRRLLTSLQYRDSETVRHVRRVALMCVAMAKHLGWEDRSLKILEVAALLHDIGKIGVPDNILFKPGKLNPNEAHLMTLHYNITQSVLQACRVDHNVINIISNLQSRYHDTCNGCCTETPLGARLLSVADAYDSMSHDQVYRPKMRHDEIMATLNNATGTQFDGNVVDALSRWLDTVGHQFFEQTRHQLDKSPSRDFSLTIQPDGTLGDERNTRSSQRQATESADTASLCRIFSYLHQLESMYDGFYVVDPKMKTRIWNHGMEQLLGHASSDVLGQSWADNAIRYADDYGTSLPHSEIPIQRVLRDGRSFTGECSVQHVDGQWVRVEVQSIPIWDEKGHLHGVAEIFRNLSRSNSHPIEFRELKLAATRDPLTSLNNRGEIETQLARHVNHFNSSRAPQPLSLIFLDIDLFKSINDTYGHDVGDAVLIETARLLQMELYSGEIIGRFGGEEFVIVNPETNLEQTVLKAERLRTALSRLSIPQLEGRQVTASFGVTEAEFGDSIESILKRADTALYRAKNAGRNCTKSLTQDQLYKDEEIDEAAEEGIEDLSFVAKGSFESCIAANIIVYKLSGFVNEFNAKVVSASPERAVIRLGRKGLFPYWSAADDGKPVELELVFGETYNKVVNGRKSSVSRVQIHYQIKPLGRVRKASVFQSRAKQVLKDLRAFFAAE